MSSSSRAFGESSRRLELYAQRPAVLADALPGAAVRDVVLVLAYAALVGLFAQVAIPLWWTPVPITGQTFGVMVGGAALGWQRSLTGMLLYVLMGLLGVPWFAQHKGGMAVLSSPSFGYVVGFVVAALLLGVLAGRGWDRTVPKAVAMFALGSLVVYAFGVPWLMVATDIGLQKGLANGLTPFLVGDAIKVLVAGGLLPGAWALLRRSG